MTDDKQKAKRMMTDDAYTHTQNVVTAVCQTVTGLDLGGFKDRLDEAAFTLQANTALDSDGVGAEKLGQLREVTAHLVELSAMCNRHAQLDIDRAAELEERVKGIEARHEEDSHTTAEPIIPSDPRFLLEEPEGE